MVAPGQDGGRSDTVIPASWLRPATCHRTLPGSSRAVLSCGVVTKRGTGWDHRRRPDHYSVVWCLQGRGRYHDFRGRVWPLGPGDLFIRFTDRDHQNELDPLGAWAEAYIGFGAPLGEALLAMGAVDPDRPVLHPGLDLVLLRSLIAERDALGAALDRELPAHLGRLVALHQELLARSGAEGAAGPHGAALDRACRRLAEEPRLGLRELARDTGLSYERFRKIFRQRLGVSPHEYRIRRRIERARALLQAGELPVGAIAAQLGYANPFQFSAQFRLVVGVSPQAYRRRGG